jgi:hypothetical protein
LAATAINTGGGGLTDLSQKSGSDPEGLVDLLFDLLLNKGFSE